MQNRTFALLVHNSTNRIRSEVMESLRRALRKLSVDTWSVRNRDEAGSILAQNHPEIIFTDSCLADGSWVDIVNTNKNAEAPANVIVVNPTADTQLYITAMERGAYDFVVPPFEQEGLAHIVRSAQDNARSRREAQARPVA